MATSEQESESKPAEQPITKEEEDSTNASTDDAVQDDDDKSNTNDDNNNGSTQTDENPAAAPPALTKKLSTTTTSSPNLSRKRSSNVEMLKKLRNILDGVASQEADLKRRAHKIEEWHTLHREALTLAGETKKRLIEFVPVDDNDDEETKMEKTKKKTLINSSLDELEKQLKKLNASESKYRSRQCVQESHELNETIKKLQNKYIVLSKKYNQQISDMETLTKHTQEQEARIKQMTEAHKKAMENQKKELTAKHKDYIQNLQAQHESLLKKQKDENMKSMEKEYQNEKNALNTTIQSLESDLEKLKQEHSEERQKEVSLVKREKETELEKVRMELEKTLSDYKALEDKLSEKEEEISECRSREKAHNELMLKWQAQKEKKNEKINELTETMESLNIKMETLESERQSLQETAALNSVQITQKDSQFNELNNKYSSMGSELERLDKDKKLLEAKLKVSIKEIIKLRQEVKDKEEKKTELLTTMSNMEIEEEKNKNALHAKIADLQNDIKLLNGYFENKFQALNDSLNDVHSKLESFSVTIRNLGGNALKQSYDTELEARKKSNEELPIWLDNIREQVRKATEQITINGICGGMNEEMNEAKQQQHMEKQNQMIKESETQIAHIKLTGLQLLQEYTQLLLEYNALYISYNDKKSESQNDSNSNGNKKRAFGVRRKSSNK